MFIIHYTTWRCGKVHESINRSFCTTWISLRFERPRKEFGGISSMSLLSGMRISENYYGDDDYNDDDDGDNDDLKTNL